MKATKNIALTLTVAFGTAFAVGCGDDNGTSGVGQSSAGLTSSIEDVPVVGQLLSDCLDTGLAISDAFSVGTPLEGELSDLPSLEEVLANADTSTVPVLGGFIPDPGDPTVLLPIGTDAVQEQLAGTPLGDLPVDASVPVVCSQVPVPTEDLPNPTEALGVLPIFDEAGDPVGLVLATVNDVQSGAPSGGLEELILSGGIEGDIGADLAAALDDLLATLGLPSLPL